MFYVGSEGGQYAKSYKNNCEVKYFKYFANSVCTGDEVKRHAKCMDIDKCHEFNEPTGVDEKPTVEGHSPIAHKFEEKDGKSGKSFVITAWVKCANNGGAWWNMWHLSEKNLDRPRHAAMFINVGWKSFHGMYAKNKDKR